MRNKILHIAILLQIVFSLESIANHLIGGELSYTKLNGNQYEIKLKVYRDCNAANAANFDNPANIGIYANGQLIEELSIDLGLVFQVDPPVLPSCVQAPSNVCVQGTVYTAIVNLPPNAFGYDLVYTRCCRNGTIQNINDPSETGSTYYAKIPATTTASNNSNPSYINFPPIFLCLNTPFTFDHSAFDADGDSLVYYFCTPYAGASETQPMPIPPEPPPFPNVNWSGTYNVNNQMPSLPAMNINSQTGLLTVKPTNVGQFVVGVCVSEYRNGVLLSEGKRDFQFNVVNCQNAIATIPQQTSFCDGLTVNFGNQSFNSNTFFWDFGVPGTTTDVSNLSSPSYTYPAPGTYTVTLIASNVVGGQVVCADTATSTFQVTPLLAPDFIQPQPQCIEGNVFQFFAGGAFDPSAIFQWQFNNANINVANAQNVNNVSFNQPGIHDVKLIVSQFGCTDTVIKQVEINPTPDAEIGDENRYCMGLQVDFQNLSEQWPNNTYHWDFGVPSLQNDTSILYSPSYTYIDTGVYLVKLKVTSENGCVAFDEKNFLVYPLLLPGIIPFDNSPNINQCVDVNYFNFYAGGVYSSETNFLWNFGANANINQSTQLSVDSVSFNQAGFFPVTLTVSENGCSKSITDTARVYLRPQIDYNVNVDKCYPFKVDFNESCFAQTPISFYWNYGNGEQSNLSDHFYEYYFAGSYLPSLKIITETGCKDTLEQFLGDSLRFLPPPEASLEINPLRVSIFEPEVKFLNTSKNHISTYFYSGTGSWLNTVPQSVVYTDTGTYKAAIIVLNEDNCSDTAFYDVIVYPEFRLWIPNTFTPNGDNINDVFKPIIIGGKRYDFKIFNRWGEIVFSTTELMEGWNGQFMNTGENSPSGVYVYNIYIESVIEEKAFKTGKIVLQR